MLLLLRPSLLNPFIPNSIQSILNAPLLLLKSIEHAMQCTCGNNLESYTRKSDGSAGCKKRFGSEIFRSAANLLHCARFCNDRSLVFGLFFFSQNLRHPQKPLLNWLISNAIAVSLFLLQIYRCACASKNILLAEVDFYKPESCNMPVIEVSSID